MKAKCRNCSTQLPMDENTSCPECHSGDPFGMTEARDFIEKTRKEMWSRYFKMCGMFVIMIVVLSAKMPGAEFITLLLMGYMLYLLFELYFKNIKQQLFPMLDGIFECTEDEEAQQKVTDLVKEATKRLYIPELIAYENDKLIK